MKYGEEFFIRECSDSGGGNNLKLNEDRFRLDIRKKFLTQSVERHWNKLPEKLWIDPSLEVFKATMGGALGNLILWKPSLPLAEKGA